MTVVFNEYNEYNQMRLDFGLLLKKKQGSKDPKVTCTSHLISRRKASKALFLWATARVRVLVPPLLLPPPRCYTLQFAFRQVTLVGGGVISHPLTSYPFKVPVHLRGQHVLF